MRGTYSTEGYAPFYRGLLDHRARMGFAGAAVYDTLLLMADHNTGDITTCYQDIADLFGVSRDTVRRSMTVLEEQGYIERDYCDGGSTMTTWRITKFKTASQATNKRRKADRIAAETRMYDSARDREIAAAEGVPMPSHLKEKAAQILQLGPVDNFG